MLVIGLTGGIGSGKSTVTALFTALGIPVIDTDRIAREVVLPGSPVLQQVVDRFGTEALNPDGTLNRVRMRERVFADPGARLALEAILHPPIRAATVEHLAALDSPYAVLAIPLLVETNGTDRVDRVLVVDLPEQQQIERVCSRDGITQEQARAILAAQCSREQRLAAADDVIDNGGDREKLASQVRALHEKYLALAQQK